MHLLVNGEAANPSKSAVKSALEAIPRIVGLKIIYGPKAYQKRGRIIGMVIIAESHVAIHIEGGRFFGDVFTCREFDTRPVIEYFTQTFGLTKVTSALIERGIEYIREIPIALP